MEILKNLNKHLQVKVFLYKYYTGINPITPKPPDGSFNSHVFSEQTAAQGEYSKYKYIEKYLVDPTIETTSTTVTTTSDSKTSTTKKLETDSNGNVTNFVPNIDQAQAIEDTQKKILKNQNRTWDLINEGWKIHYLLFQLQSRDNTLTTTTIKILSDYGDVTLKNLINSVKSDWVASKIDHTDVKIVSENGLGVYSVNNSLASSIDLRWYTQTVAEYDKNIKLVVKYLNSDLEKYKKAKINLDKATKAVNNDASFHKLIERYYTKLEPANIFVYDISNYFQNFNFNQDLSDGIPNWNITFQDAYIDPVNENKAIVPANNIVTGGITLTSEPIGGTTSSSKSFTLTSSIGNISGPPMTGNKKIEVKDVSNYLANYINKFPTYLGTPITDSSRQDEISIASGILKRGLDLNGVQKIRLSDLIQQYNFISIYTYSGSTPPPTIDLTSVTNTTNFEETLITSKSESGENFVLDFDGFVRQVTFNRAVGSVDSVTVNGTGAIGLLAATKRIYSPTFLQDTIYDLSEEYNLTSKERITVYQSLFANKNPIEIISQLLLDTMKIREIEHGGYFDEDLLYSENELMICLYVIPVFLYTEVMRRRNYRVQNAVFNGAPEKSIYDSNGQTLRNLTSVSTTEFSTAQTNINNSPTGFHVVGNNDIIQYDPSLDSKSLKSYFILLSNSFADYQPILKSPLDIINEVRTTTYLEFFEDPGKGFIFREPQWNSRDPNNLIFSSDLDLISQNYSPGDITQIISRQKVTYALDFGIDLPLNIFAYINGKITSTYGLNETSTLSNPNARFMNALNTKKLGTDANKKLATIKDNYSAGMFNFAKFILHLYNYGLSVGTVVCSYDSQLKIGNMFYDLINMKVGYIKNINKTCSVSSTYTVTANLTFVRDLGTGYTFQEIPMLSTSVDYFSRSN